jgi:hypothetical protein
MTRLTKAFVLFALAAAIAYPGILGPVVGLHRPFNDIADQDMVVMPQALLINEGQANTYHEHPGSLTIRAAAGWIKLTRLFGAKNVVQISELPRDGIARELHRLAGVGRQLAIANMMVFLAVFAFTLRVLTSDLLLITIGTWLMSASQGVFLETITIRTEPISMTLTLATFAAALLAVRHAPRKAVVAAAAAGLFAYVAMLNKVQAGIGLAAFPVLLTAFAKPPLPSWTQPSLRPLAVIALASVGVAWLAASTFAAQRTLAVAEEGMSSYHWGLLVIFLLCAVAMVVLKGWSWRHVAALTLASLSGFLVGYFANAPIFDERDHHSVLYFIEHLSWYCTGDCNHGALRDIPGLLRKVAKVTFESKVAPPWGANPYPFLVIYWVAFCGGIVCLVRRRWWRAVRIFMLLGLALAIENVFRLRYVDTKSLPYVCYYYGMVEPFVVIAAVLAFTGMESTRWRTASRAAFAAIAAVVVVMSTWINLVWYEQDSFNGLGMRQEIKNFCYYIGATQRVYELVREAGICP